MTDSFFINSEAMSPNPAPCSQSRTRSKFVRICTALDHENSPSEKRGRGCWRKQKKHLKKANFVCFIRRSKAVSLPFIQKVTFIISSFSFYKLIPYLLLN